MTKTKLHIISFDVPYPADYGGVIDVFYKIKSLAAQGVEIYLHCFQYGRTEAKVLEQYCKAVYYYPRKTGLQGLSLTLPYMLYSRRDEQLLQNLLAIDAPILFEGVHTCYLLQHPSLSERKKIVRNHNVEQEYYAQLAGSESTFFKKIYYKIESAFLKKFELKLTTADYLLPISQSDSSFFKKLLPQAKVACVNGFHPFDTIISKTGKSDFCLYQGNLAHPENIEAALFLIEKVFTDLSEKLVIAGRNPDATIVRACAGKKNIELVANPSEVVMNHLIATAQIQVLPTFQASGLKLKLLYALFGGRFIIANKRMLNGTGLEDLCIIADDNAADFKQKILLAMQAEFDENDFEKRKNILSEKYNNTANALLIKDILLA